MAASTSLQLQLAREIGRCTGCGADKWPHFPNCPGPKCECTVPGCFPCQREARGFVDKSVGARYRKKCRKCEKKSHSQVRLIIIVQRTTLMFRSQLLRLSLLEQTSSSAHNNGESPFSPLGQGWGSATQFSSSSTFGSVVSASNAMIPQQQQDRPSMSALLSMFRLQPHLTPDLGLSDVGTWCVYMMFISCQLML